MPSWLDKYRLKCQRVWVVPRAIGNLKLSFPLPLSQDTCIYHLDELRSQFDSFPNLVNLHLRLRWLCLRHKIHAQPTSDAKLIRLPHGSILLQLSNLWEIIEVHWCSKSSWMRGSYFFCSSFLFPYFVYCRHCLHNRTLFEFQTD